MMPPKPVHKPIEGVPYLDTPLSTSELDHCEAFARRGFYVGVGFVERMVREIRASRALAKPESSDG